jgi:hypothetical protein
MTNLATNIAIKFEHFLYLILICKICVRYDKLPKYVLNNTEFWIVLLP